MRREELSDAIKRVEREQRQLNTKVNKEIRDANATASAQLTGALGVMEKRYQNLEAFVVEVNGTLKGIDMKLDAIRSRVEEYKTVGDSAVALLQGLKAKLDEMASQDTVDPTEVQELADAIGNETGSIANAVKANTPASSEPTPDVPETPVE